MHKHIQDKVDNYYRNYYERVHSNLRSGFSFSFHFQLEATHTFSEKFPVVVELGAGNSDHLKFVKHSFDTYLLTDIRELNDDRIPEVHPGIIPKLPGVYKSIIDARGIPFLNESVDRILSGCLLLHVDDPIDVLEGWLRVLKVGGVIDTLIPNDHSLPVRLYRFLYSRRKSRQLGFNDFDLVNAAEHRSYYERIFQLVHAAFPNHEIVFQHYPPAIGNVRFLRAYSILRIKKY